MSGFDEEAERERLREKYEQDQEKRAATQRMSELLLKGATMTNSHCDTCGDPVFRYDGQEFCPTCRAAEAEAEAEAAEATAESESDDAAGAGTVETETAAATGTDTADRSTLPSAGGSPANAAADGQVGDSTTDAETHREGSRRRPTRSDAPAASLDDAHASLTRTLVRYARAAEETDDPRRAQELLAAAREAAETLAALDRR